jgi:hypothetical protein
MSISRALSKHISITVCGNAPNVRSLFQRSKGDGGWQNVFFLEDGDNECSPFPDEDNFIHLDKYCIENYLLDLGLASACTGLTIEEVKDLIFTSIIGIKSMILGKTKFLEFLIDRFTPEDLTEDRLAKIDASLILPHFLRDVGLTFEEYLDRYVAEAIRRGELSRVFPEKLINAIETQNN